MKSKKIAILLTFIFISISLFSSALSITGQEDLHESPTSFFELDAETNFTMYSTGPLEWRQYNPVNMTIFINSTILPTDVNITIVSISIYYNTTTESRGILETILTPNKNITQNNQLLELRKQLLPPEDAEEFEITFIILAKSTQVVDNQAFRAYFPGDGTKITIKEDIVLPIINLPGFPDAQTFLRWMFIFVVSFILIALPGIFTVSFKIKEKIEDRKKGGKDE